MRTCVTPASRKNSPSAFALVARDFTMPSAMSSASGFQRNRRVRAATRGNALAPEVTSGATTGKVNTPASRQRRAVMTKVAWVVGERPEQALDGSVVLVVVEHDQPLRAARQEFLQALHAAVAAAGAEAQREHLAQGVEAPARGAEPVDAAAERCP